MNFRHSNLKNKMELGSVLEIGSCVQKTGVHEVHKNPLPILHTLARAFSVFRATLDAGDTAHIYEAVCVDSQIWGGVGESGGGSTTSREPRSSESDARVGESGGSHSPSDSIRPSRRLLPSFDDNNLIFHILYNINVCE